MTIAHVSHPDAIREVNAIVRALRAKHLAPPPHLSVSEWADSYRVLSREASAEPGAWRTDRVPYIRGILDAVSDPHIERVVVMSSSQAGKSEVLLNVIGFFMHQDPAPMMLVQPTIGEAEQFSKTRIAPMLRDTPALRDSVRDPRSRDAGNTLLVKEYSGGHLTIVGANAPSGLAAKPIRVVLFDEVDRYPSSAGTEGDPIQLATRRTATFWNRKLVMVSTPTLKGFSRIESAYMEGDQRVYEVPCWKCGAFQRLLWGRLLWPKGDAARANYACGYCDAPWSESQKLPALRPGRWVPTAEGDGRTASFHVSALYSPFVRWADLASEWATSQGSPERLQVFVNTLLGECWDATGGGLSADTLRSRVEAYADEDGVAVDVPDGVGVLTAGIDVQADRLEVVVRGWGAGEESWLIARRIILGDPAQADIWDQLDALLSSHWTHAGGRPLTIGATCIDSGYMTDQVYRFCKPRYSRRIYATKGSSAPGKPVVPKRPSTNNKGGVRLFVLGTDAAKDVLYARLRIQSPGPGYVHLNSDADEDYAAQITAERAERVKSGGQWVRRYVVDAHRRNEVVDCEVGAYAALLLGPVPRERLALRAARLSERADSVAKMDRPTVEPPVSIATERRDERVKALRKSLKKSFVTGWKR